MKKFTLSLTVFCLLTLNLFAQTLSQIPAGGLIAYYPFNGNAHDESGDGYDGTVNGAVLIPDRFGHANSAYSLYGDNDSIETTLSGFTTNSHLTVSFWIKGGSGGLYCMQNGDFGVAAQSSHIQMAISVPSTNSSGGFIDSSKWSHFVGTYDGATIRTYVDDVAIDSIVWAGPIFDANRHLVMGSFGTDNWNGCLDDIVLYNRVLGQAGIDSLYHVGGFTGTKQITLDNSVSIYPVPCNGKINMRVNNTSFNNSIITVTDVVGRQVYQSAITPQTSHTQIDLSHVAEGVYTVTLLQDSRVVTRRISVVR